MRSRSKKVRRLKPPLLNVAKSMGKWKPSDDYLLIHSVAHLESLLEVYMFTKFSKKFSLKEIEHRWFAILYDAPISRMIYKNLKKIHPDDVLRLKKLVPFNLTENSILLNLNSTINPSDEFFLNLLNENRTSFLDSRSPGCLRNQFYKLKDLNLLKNQLIEQDRLESNESKQLNRLFKTSFEDAENEIHDMATNEKPGTPASYEAISNQIKRAEADLFLWQLLVDKISEGSSNLFSEPDTIAVLFNENFEFAMKQREVTIGRSSENIDIQITRIQSGVKISRRQCTITKFDANKFIIINNGKCPIFVDGRPIVSKSKTELYDKSIIEIGKCSLLFLVNYNNISLVDSGGCFDKIV